MLGGSHFSGPIACRSEIMKPPPIAPAFATSPPRWKTAFFAEPEADLADAFQRDITWDNLQRARLLSWFIVTLTVLVLGTSDIFFWRSGLWQVNPAHIWWAACHSSLFLTGVAALIIMRLRRRTDPSHIVASDPVLLDLFIAVFLGLLICSTLVQQQITGQVTTPLLGIGVYGSCFYSRPRTSLLMIGGVSAVLFITLPIFQPNPATLVNHFVATLVFAVIFWFVSRLIYSLRAHDFNQLHTIASQAKSLEDANARLREANELKAELVGIAAHDLRDPLNAIGALAQELQADLPDSSPAYDLAKGIDESTWRISHLIENLITEAEKETSGLQLVREPHDVSALVAEVVSDYRWLANSKQLTLTTDVPEPGSLWVSLDPNRVRQLLENVLSNAIKYSPANKTVHVRVFPLEPKGARLEVRDEGAGLSVEDQSRLFQKFQRLSARPTNREGTSGLGLAIVKAIVDAHGGRVWAESAGLHRGATFIIELP